MNAQKLSISLPQQEVEFIRHYQEQHHLKARSDVIKEALRLLHQAELEAYYQEANAEIDNDFENCHLDGIE